MCEQIFLQGEQKMFADENCAFSGRRRASVLRRLLQPLGRKDRVRYARFYCHFSILKLTKQFHNGTKNVRNGTINVRNGTKKCSWNRIMVLKCRVWPCVAVYGRVWACMVVYGCVWPCMAVYDRVRPCMAVYGRVFINPEWCLVALYGLSICSIVALYRFFSRS